MAIGKSGRVVIDLTPEQKQAIHAAIQKQGKNLKQWFLEHADADFPEELKGLMPSSSTNVCKR